MRARRKTVAVVGAAVVLLGGGSAAAAGMVTEKAAAGAGSTAQYSSPAAGHVLGTFLRVGGPPGPGGKQPAAVPLPGTMRFTRAGYAPITVQVGKTGAFGGWLAPGRYQVSGTTPGIQGEPGNIDATCPLQGSLVASAGLTRHITVVCAVP